MIIFLLVFSIDINEKKKIHGDGKGIKWNWPDRRPNEEIWDYHVSGKWEDHPVQRDK